LAIAPQKHAYLCGCLYIADLISRTEHLFCHFVFLSLIFLFEFLSQSAIPAIFGFLSLNIWPFCVSVPIPIELLLLSCADLLLLSCAPELLLLLSCCCC
jgi:hypothetical protein